MTEQQQQTNELAGRVILVTGSTQGIGRAVAMECARQGATVVLVAKNVKRLEAVYDAIEAAGYPQPAALPLDLLNAGAHEFEQGAMHIRSALGRLDGVAHCASHFINLSPLDNQSLQDWLDILRVNLAAAHALNRAVFSLLTASEDASVVFTGESHGHQPKAFWGAYAVAKSGLEALTRIAADEWEMYPHLRVNLLIPGAVDSPLRSKTHPAELKAPLPSCDAIARRYIYWLSGASRGQSGQIVEL